MGSCGWSSKGNIKFVCVSQRSIDERHWQRQRQVYAEICGLGEISRNGDFLAARMA